MTYVFLQKQCCFCVHVLDMSALCCHFGIWISVDYFSIILAFQYFTFSNSKKSLKKFKNSIQFQENSENALLFSTKIHKKTVLS